ncbi:MAG: 1-deoxy-D-xylulose-5-phosphate reductoisomerase [Thermodesulfobacterium geofontis]|uniref:1-deoxy-D-xylulose 5-phosphate reductoisomerase n=1 Tax=Thermodesulfobacterium geofontis TaxID=1295609 RepID=A0A2N7PQR0_9BACT|nr:MAG: 1-deoxy-D-xylulose-5-phosphate reductoisomerase [Thermodesulfobacterium geofontis]
MKNIAIFGATGSIGKSTIEYVKNFSDKFRIVGLTARTKIRELQKLSEIFKVPYIVVEKEEDAKNLKSSLSYRAEVLWGDEGLKELASLELVNTVVIGISGIKALIPTYYALKTGKRVAIANKECIISVGNLLKEVAKICQAELIPVDSEHSAFFQLLQKEKKEYIEKLILTASGGPFYKTPLKDFSKITPEKAIAHPTWKMGKKISVDSATLMNKGFEVLEAMVLFDIPLDKIEVVIHPQSLIHGIVKLIDGCYFMHLSPPDMKIAIAYALNYPERTRISIVNFDLAKVKKLIFEKPNFRKFPCLKLAYKVGKLGGFYPLILEAADEVVVEAFLSYKITFDKIPYFLEKTLNEFKIPSINLKNVYDALELHERVCEFTKNLIKRY